MKIYAKLMPYYLSRALLAALLGWLIATSSGLVWMGIVLGLLVFAGFVYYLHNGRYIVDDGHPFFPLRRDDRAESIRNKALVVSVVVAGLAYFAIFILNRMAASPAIPSSLVLPLGVVVYFVYSMVLDKKG